MADFPVEGGDAAKLIERITGVNGEFIANASATDSTPTDTNCKALWCDQAGILKFQYTDKKGVTVTAVKQLNLGVNQFRNVTKVFKLYKAGSDGTAGAYGTDGLMKSPGICLVY